MPPWQQQQQSVHKAQPTLQQSESEDESMDSLPSSTSRLREPLLANETEARPALIGAEALSTRQQRQDDRIRTLCLVVLSTAVLGYGAFCLKTILIRFVLALALRYLLMPLIDVLSCQGIKGCRYRLNRTLAILIALLIAAGGLSGLGVVVAKSIGRFAANSELYTGRVEQLIEAAVNMTSAWDLVEIGGPGGMNSTALKHTLSDLAKNNLSISHLILGLLGSAAHVVENFIYILLFLAFLLAGSGSKSGEAHGDAIDTVQAEAEEKIYRYIRGKVLISLIVAGNHACTLWAIGMRDGLWLVFAVLTVRKVDSNPRPFALLDPESLCPSRPQSAEGRTCESISGSSPSTLFPMWEWPSGWCYPCRWLHSTRALDWGAF